MNSKVIEFLRIILTVQIVFFHMAATAHVGQEQLLHGTNWGSLISMLTVLNNLAVPIFFMISGYLFSIGNNKGSYLIKLNKRVVRLLQPLIVWTSLFLLVYFIAQQIPAVASIFSGNQKLIADYKWIDFLDAYTGLCSGFPFLTALWFVRNLFILSLLFPILHTAVSWRKGWGFAVIFIACLAYRFENFYTADSVFFFSLGMFLFEKKELLELMKRYANHNLIIFPLLAAICFWGYIDASYSYLYNLFFYFYVASGFLLLTSLSDAILNKLHSDSFLRLAESSFFIFLSHQQLLMLLKRAIYKFIPVGNAYEVFLIYLILPVCVVVVLFFLFRLMQAYCPHFLEVLIGKRGVLQA